MKRMLFIVLLILVCLGSTALAQEQIWSLQTEDGRLLTQITYEPEEGDEYIAGDNQLYEVIRMEGNRVIVRGKGTVELPDVSWLDADEALPVSALGRDRRIALYCTHSDESYEPSDGKYSDEERGSIYQIARALADSLQENGIEATVSDTLHHPHDAGAYRRSRQTAVQLLKETTPDALLDIHRDGIPDPDEYAATIGGRPCSKIRLLVGRGNQNMEVNKEFALTIKAVADKVYPGLIKDIYMGKGAYNQDLAPRSVLLEFGTHTLSKERVLNAVKPMSEVIYKAMYGGVTGSAGASDVSSSRSAPKKENEPSASKPVSEDNTGSSWAVWLILGLLVLLGIFAFLSTGGKGAGRSFGRSISEMTGGLLGKKPPRDEQ